ncbi:exodeoxyribonuclease V subunit alpha [Aestuariibacter salexigens]|uniref:exodeoxyribonuclease V subunit alpha n=1 Tax=Aestuariibacter salexigens TaxID=226010 RepID=UPI000417D2E4|nr:exodeoxyribonuclease V subunit alpha [Aestuariibacter salexigens]
MSMPFASSVQCINALAGIAAIDYFVACKWYQQALGEESFYLLLALSYHQRHGHSCVDLSCLAGSTLWRDDDTRMRGYTFSDQSTLTGLARRLSDTSGGALVVFEHWFYSARFFEFEQDVATRLCQLDRPVPLTPEGRPRLQEMWHLLFPANSDNASPDAQQIAVANAVGRGVTLLCGGPGTGKTYTAARMLSAMLLADPALNIMLAAPTGKAAQRLTESIIDAKQGLAASGIPDEVLKAVPEQAATIHRLLGVRPDSVDLRHNQKHPFAVDVLLIDEASMLDVAMMARVLRAMPEHGRLILLGDVDQLPAVEAGNVLAELHQPESSGYGKEDAERILALSGQRVAVKNGSTGRYVNLLTRSRRFGGDIGHFATDIIRGDAQQSWQRLLSDSEQLFWLESDNQAWLQQLVAEYYLPVFTSDTVHEAFARLKQFRILSPTRHGIHGIINLNEKVESLLAKSFPFASQQRFYQGRPIMVTENNYSSGLFNGDIGLIWPDQQGKLYAWFETGNDSYRRLNIARLPAHETVYAMTIHKTQGSEFNHVALVLPDMPNALLNRELLYTAVTRAKMTVTVCANEHVWKDAVLRRVERYSGLARLLETCRLSS